MGFMVTSRQSGSTTIVDVSGPVMYGEAGALQEMLLELVKKGQRNILLNLGNVSHLDSSGISTLVRGYTTIKNAGGHLKVLQLSKHVQRLLEITNLTKVFEDFSDEETALRSFS